MNLLGHIRGLLFVGSAKEFLEPSPPVEEWRRNFNRQLALEAEGAARGLQGATRAECPYNKETHSFEWNHWVYGCESAVGEAATIKSGTITFCSTGVGADGKPLLETTMPVEQAMAMGWWKPRYVSLSRKDDDPKMAAKSTDDYDR